MSERLLRFAEPQLPFSCQSARHADHVVASGASLRNRDETGRRAALQRDAVEHGVSEERTEQDDRSEVAIGDEMSERPGLDGDEEGVLHLRLDLVAASLSVRLKGRDSPKYSTCCMSSQP